jgi:sugar lactone lactonase YvrE
MVETTYTATAIDGTTYTQSAGMDGATTTDNVTELAAQAAASAAAAAADLVETAQDVIDAAASATEAAASAASLSVDTASVAAAGALMDSELTSIADVKALDQSVVSGATPTLGIANMTLDDTSLTVSDTTNLQTFAEGVDSALLRARGTGVSSTYVSTVSIGGTTFAQPAVSGEINSDQGYFEVSYAGATGITVATLSATSTYVYIDNAGNLQQQTTIPTRQDWSRKMFTMRIGVNAVTETIINFEYLNNPIGHYANSIRDLYTYLQAQGVPFRIGQLITGRTDNLGFDVGAGSVMEFGGTGDIDNANIKSFDAATNVSYFLFTKTTGEGANTDLVKSWDNADTITALGSTTCVAHRVYRFSSGSFAIQYGQGNYANMVLARAGARLEAYELNPVLEDATFMGWWLLEETATATSGTADAEFVEYTIGVQGGSSSSLAGALLKGNNLSDLLDASAARTNLGLGTAATTAAADYATAAQGTLADDAAPLASPTFTGTPAGPTATVGTDTTQLATTAFVLANGAASAVAALSPAATVDISLASADYFTLTPDQNTTITVSDVSAVDTFNLALTGYTVSSTLYGIDNASYDSVSFSVASQETVPQGMFFKPDGTKVYVAGYSGYVYQYSLSTADDLSTASYDSVSFNANSQEGSLTGVFFKPDGSKMYLIGTTADTIYQYSLSTAWVVSSASYDSVSFSVASQEANPQTLFFKPDGTEMYVAGITAKKVFQYALSTAWVVSSASYSSVNFDPVAQSVAPNSVFFTPDGSKMFLQGQTLDAVLQYSLSTAWLVSSASYDSISFDISGQADIAQEIVFNSDGAKMYVIDNGTDIIYQYSTGSLVTATVTYPASFNFPAGTPPAVPLDGVLNILEGQTTDGGTSWNVRELGAAFS